ncbi:MAG: ATP-binding cassette domain-containing protein, partial [Bacteroidota bacterium]
NAIELPCVVHLSGRHFSVLYKITSKHVFLSDPVKGRKKISIEEFNDRWVQPNEKGVLLELKPTSALDALGLEKRAYPTNRYATVRFFLKYLARFKRSVYQMLLVTFFVTLLQALFPFITRAIVDIGITANDLSFIQLLLLANVVLVFSTIAGNWIRSYLNIKIALKAKFALLSDYLFRLFRLPISFFENMLIGDLMQRAKDNERIESFLVNSFFSIIVSFFNLLVFALILYTFSSTIFWIFIGFSSLYLVWILVFWKTLKKLDTKYIKHLSDNQSNWVEMLVNIQEIKTQHYETEKKRKWWDIQSDLYRVRLNLFNYRQIQKSGATLINGMRDAVLIYFTAVEVLDGSMTLGMMLSIQFILGYLKGPINDIISFVGSYQGAYLSFQRVQEISRVPPEVIANQQVINANFLGHFQTRKVSFRYNVNSPFVLRNLDIFIPYQTTTAIVGRSGSGKSSLLKLLSKTYQPSVGEILINGQNFNSIPVDVWRKKVGILNQTGALFNESIVKNIILSNEYDPEKMNQVLYMVGIKREIESMQDGLNTMLRENGRGLSEGQKQRILIARVLYKEPDFLFLDEFANHLDPKVEKLIINNIKTYAKDLTMIFTSHKFNTLMLASNIIVMDNGRAVEAGPIQDLIKNKGHFCRLFEDDLKHSGEIERLYKDH